MEQHPIKINKVQIRNLQIEDYVQLSQSFTRVYSDGSDVFWTREQIQKLIKIFPEGQIVTVVDDKIVGCALSIIVDYDKAFQIQSCKGRNFFFYSPQRTRRTQRVDLYK